MGTVKNGTAPIVIDETPGTKAYCQCGNSAKLPYCDGSHSRERVEVGPMIVEIKEAGKKATCQCHKSGNLPWCDGSHSRLSKEQ